MEEVRREGRKDSRQATKEAMNGGITIITSLRAQKLMSIKSVRIDDPDTGQKWVWNLPEMVSEMDNYNPEMDRYRNLSISDNFDSQRV